MYSWQQILEELPRRDQLVILRKPFDPIEVRHLAACLSEKWRRGRAIEQQMQELEMRVSREVTRRLELELGALQKFDALGRLTAGIAHEISTPMQCAHSSFEFLQDVLADCDEDVRGAIADGLEGMRRASAIVRSIGEYSHSRPGPGPVDLNRQVQMAAQLARTEYRHDADLVLDLGELPPLHGYADELGRAILNLVVNASHAIAAKRRPSLDQPCLEQIDARGTITIVTRAVAGGVRLSISDTGTGIAPEHRARIFEPFFTTKSLGKGTGQGLAMVHTTVVEHHHGAIEVDSLPGHGTTFHLQLPLSIQVAAA
jgi:two-component system NtrC family sensor kinase